MNLRDRCSSVTMGTRTVAVTGARAAATGNTGHETPYGAGPGPHRHTM